MLLALNSTTGMNSVAQFITVLLIFIGVLFLTYFSTRWIASYQKGRMYSSNISVVETFKITANKYIQIIRIGERYFAIAVGKDEVTLLAELKEDELTLQNVMQTTPTEDFKNILEKAKNFKFKK
ncbi:MAG: flagellar biosynthetic protein FliO [Lachnospiraceae bacterium]|nr:flagellar biosynthetic protein FliO [Lachnospiraceae bacterium]